MQAERRRGTPPARQVGVVFAWAKGRLVRRVLRSNNAVPAAPNLDRDCERRRVVDVNVRRGVVLLPAGAAGRGRESGGGFTPFAVSPRQHVQQVVKHLDGRLAAYSSEVCLYHEAIDAAILSKEQIVRSLCSGDGCAGGRRREQRVEPAG